MREEKVFEKFVEPEPVVHVFVKCIDCKLKGTGPLPQCKLEVKGDLKFICGFFLGK